MTSPVPEQPDFSELEAQLRNVPLPVGLSARLRAAAFTADDDLDEALCRVPTPPGLVLRLMRIPRRAASRARMFAVAAGLLLAIGCGYWIGAGSGERSIAGDPSKAVPELAASRPGMEEFTPDAAPLGPLDPLDNSPLQGFAAGELAPFEALPLASTFDEPPPSPGSLKDLANGLRRRSPWDLPAAEVTSAPFGADGSFDELPEIAAVDAGSAASEELPNPNEYDLLALSRTGRQPWVLPVGEKFAVSKASLSTSTLSFERALAALAEGKLPPRATTRVEDFLAALREPHGAASSANDAAAGLQMKIVAGTTMANTFPALPKSVGVDGGNVQAMLITATAPTAGLPPSALAARVPVRWTVALDASGRMRRRGRWSMVQQAIRELAARLQPGDAINLVAFGQRADIVAEGVESKDITRLTDALATIEPVSGQAAIAAGVRLAASVAKGGSAQLDRRLVVLSDSFGQLAATELAELGEALRPLADDGVSVRLAHLDADLDAASPFAPDLKLRWVAATSQRELDLALADDMQPAVKRLTITVQFDSAAVVAYRLVGHEPTLLPLGETLSTTVELRPRESVRLLYQLRLKSGGGNDVARVSAAWEDGAGRSLSADRPVSRLQFAHLFRHNPASLQAALFAASIGEALRGDGASQAARGLAAADRMLDELCPTARQTVTASRLVELLEHARSATRGR